MMVTIFRFRPFPTTVSISQSPNRSLLLMTSGLKSIETLFLIGLGRLPEPCVHRCGSVNALNHRFRACLYAPTSVTLLLPKNDLPAYVMQNNAKDSIIPVNTPGRKTTRK